MTTLLRRKQSGYLYGVPVALALIGVALAIIVPLVPPVAAKVVLIAGAVIAIGALYYMIVVPGWLPEQPTRTGRVARLVKFLVLAALILIALGFLVSPAAGSTERSQGESPPIPVLNTFTEEVLGFSLKRPQGWRIRYATGTIVILQDDQARAGVLIYPVRPKPGFNPQEFLNSYLTLLKASSTGATKINFTNLGSDRAGATAQVSGVVSGTPIAGLATALAQGPDYVLTVIWAPAPEFAARQERLREIAASYRRASGVALVRLTGKYFETMAPKGWQIKEESANGVNFTNAAGDAAVIVGYADFGGDSSPMTIPRLFDAATKPCSPGQQPCFSITRSYQPLGFIDAPNSRDAMGRTWSARAEEFEATLVDAAGSRAHGVLSAMVMSGRHVTGLYGWIIVHSTRVAKPEKWESQAAATAIVQDNLKIIRASEHITGRMLPKNNPYDSSTIMSSAAYKNKVQSEQSAKYQEAIMGYKPYHMPGGERVDVPLTLVPVGGSPPYMNPGSGHIWTSTLEPPPQGYVQLQ
jgi:hypothetical protein